MKTLFSFRFTTKANQVERDILLIFSGLQNFNETEFADILAAEIESKLIPDEIIIVVKSTEFDRVVHDFKNSPYLIKELNRLRLHTTVRIAKYDISGENCGEEVIAGKSLIEKFTFDAFKRKAITDIFRKRDGFIECNPLFHFENPSGKHTERFLRLSNILVQPAEIEFIAFCILPHLAPDVHAVYIDTPSLFSVVYVLREYCQKLEPNRQPLLAENFKSYSGAEKHDFSNLVNSLILISASSSANLANRLREQYGFENRQILHILYLGKTKAKCNTICDLKYHSKENPEGYQHDTNSQNADSCSMCANGSRTISLRGEHFDISGPQLDPLLLNMDDAPIEMRKLMSAFIGNDIFTIKLGQRPHAHTFNLNGAAILQSEKFRHHLDHVLKTIIPAQKSDIIFTDDYSEIIANEISQHYSNITIHSAEALTTPSPEDGNPIVVLSTAIESGRQLQDLSRIFRENRPKSSQIFIVFFEKNSAEPLRQKLSASLTFSDQPINHRFTSIHKLVLPASGSSSSWDIELKLLTDLKFQELEPKESNFFQNRRDLLSNSSQPLIDNLFLPNSRMEKLQLQPGFAFWPFDYPRYSQADVFYTIASILQKLRVNSLGLTNTRKIESNWLQQTTLAPENFGRFNDGLIQACLLRAASPQELNYTGNQDSSSQACRILKRIFESHSHKRGEAAAEFALALATKKLQLKPDDMNTLLKIRVDDPITSALLDACRKKIF